MSCHTDVRASGPAFLPGASLAIALVVLLANLSGCSDVPGLPGASTPRVVVADAAAQQRTDGSHIDEGGPDEGIRPPPESPSDRLDRLFAAYGSDVLASLRFDTTGAAAWADSVYATLTPERRVAQLLVADFGPGDGRRIPRLVTRAVAEHGVGGVLVPRTMDPRDLRSVVVELQRGSDLPLFVAADFERGAGRFSNRLTELPSNMTIGATGDTVLAAAAGRLTAIESRAIGVNLLFAPVVDVNVDPMNPIINTRSYGDDAGMVAAHAANYSAEAERWGLLTTFKHFPGHGNTSTDSHTSLAVVRSDVHELGLRDLEPYAYAGRTGRFPAGVMVGHLWVPALDSLPRASTFSDRVVAKLLREELGFGGLVFSDDIRMGGVASTHTPRERFVLALRAGVDVIVTPSNVAVAVEVISDAIASGELDAKRVEESVRRVLKTKAASGLHRRRVAPISLLDDLLAEPLGESIADTIARAAIVRFAGDEGSVWPDTMIVVHLANFDRSESISTAMDSLDAWLGVRQSIRSTSNMTDAGRAIIVRNLAGEAAPAVLVVMYQRLTAGRGSAGLYPGHASFVRDLLRLDKDVHLLNVGNPYDVPGFVDAASILVACDQTIATVRAAVATGRGRAPARGRLPVVLARDRDALADSPPVH